MRKFCTTGLCVPERNYMTDISEKLSQTEKMIRDGYYFTINRARQYGKTTMLTALQRKLHNEYLCILISFEGLGDESFESSKTFSDALMTLIQDELPYTSAALEKEYIQDWYDSSVTEFREHGGKNSLSLFLCVSVPLCEIVFLFLLRFGETKLLI